jgi:proteasome lid subunit RPN8/RPN11
VTELEIPGLDLVLQRDIYAHCFGTTDREVGGVLVGTTQRGSPPLVQGSIRAAQADETAAQLTFTQDSWEHIHRVLEQDHPTAQIVGWYHTHPGYGLFLSEQDLFVHQNFFQSRSQIALVVDPVAQEEAIYAWAGSEVKEYFRRNTSYQSSAPPQMRDQRPPAGSASAPRRRPETIQADVTISDPRNTNARGPDQFLEQLSVWADSLPLTTYVYLAAIGLSAGTVFWELVLR